MFINSPFTADIDETDVKEHPHDPLFLLQNNKFTHCASFVQPESKSPKQNPLEQISPGEHWDCLLQGLKVEGSGQIFALSI